MPDSLHDQVLDIAAPQIKALAEVIDLSFVQEVDLEPRQFNWQDVDDHSPGVSVRFVESSVRAGVMAPTNSHNPIGIPVYIVMVQPKGFARHAVDKAFRSLKQTIRQYYHHRRRMEAVSSPGVLTTVSTVEDGGPEPPRDFEARNDIQIQTIMFWFTEPQTA